MSVAMQPETKNETAAVEKAGRATWSKPVVTRFNIDEHTQGAYILGPLEIPSQCS